MSRSTQNRGGALSSLWRKRGTRWSLVFLIALAVTALLVPLIPLSSPAVVRLTEKLQAPTVESIWRDGFDAQSLGALDPLSKTLVTWRQSLFAEGRIGPILGTDALGRCVLSRILWGSRISLLVGLVASLISLVIGVLFGAIAGYIGGRTDSLLMRFVDVLYALPLMFLVIFVVAYLRGWQKDNTEVSVDSILVLFAVIGAVSWLTMARIVRTQVMSLKNSGFVDAARAAGTRPTTIFFRHLLPNAFPVVLVTLTLTIPRVMLFEAFLSFLGLGVEPPGVSWGILARQGFDALTAVHLSYWLIAVPGLAFAATLLSMNVLGDGLRDALDPRLKGGRA